ncbi:MAG: hypothetical protein MI745_14190 [Pseudomonadales bacterium]|nr:hypothetical protein [Pseudomonadales bacterium]
MGDSFYVIDEFDYRLVKKYGTEADVAIHRVDAYDYEEAAESVAEEDYDYEPCNPANFTPCYYVASAAEYATNTWRKVKISADVQVVFSATLEAAFKGEE